MSEFRKPNEVQNVYVRIGKPLTPNIVDTETYQFQLVTFQGMQVQIASKVNAQKIKSIMKQTQHLGLFSMMGQVSQDSSEYVLASVWTEELSKYSCGIITKNYSIIPQVVIIQVGNYIDNGVQYQSQKQNLAKEEKFECVNWKTDEKYSTRTNLLSPKNFGIINTPNLKIFQSNSDKSIEYTATKQKSSFALMFDFVGSLQIKDGNNPGVQVDINADTKATMFLSNSSQVLLQVDGKQASTGSVTSSTIGYNVPHIKNNLKIKPTTIFVYPLYNALTVSSNLSASIIQKNGVVARISNDTFNAIAVMQPTLRDFPGLYMKDGNQSISVDGQTFDFTDKIKITWKNSWGSFCYCPITFSQKVVFDFYFVGQLKKSTVDGVIVTYSAIPIFCNNGSGYKMAQNKIVGVPFNTDTQEMKTIWKFGFQMKTDKKETKPGELFGFIKVLKKSGKPNDVINKDGVYIQSHNRDLLNKFGCPFKIYSGTDDGWSEYITNVQTQVSFQGMSGSLTLDKYAMKKDLTSLPEQNVGAITLQAFGGAYEQFSGNKLYEQEKGLIFKGYALQTSNNLSENSATMSVSLVGVERKLQDIKMINAPFWDGDLLFGGKSSVMEYFRSYTACYLQEVSSFLPKGKNGYILPKSDNYQKPAINFTTGTSCLQALRTVAQRCDLKMVIQPNGRVYFYETDEQFLPYYLKNSSVVKRFSETQIISYNISPSLQNRFNSFATMGFLTTSTPSSQFDPTKVGTIPGILFDSNPPKNGFDFPWSRIISEVIPGWLTAQQLQEQHRINIKRGKAQIYQGNIQVAGISNLYLYDKIMIGETTYFITGISQNIDLQNKVWTTDLNIARYYSR